MRPQNRHICPTCGYEYESWVRVCPDCDTPTEWRPPELRVIKGMSQIGSDDADPQWTVAGNVPNAIIGNLIKSQLEDAGVPVLLMRSPSADIAEFSHNDFVPHDLRVPRHLVSQARALIDSPPSSDFDSQDWDDLDQEQEVGPSPEGEVRRSHSLPDGWNLLTTDPLEKDRLENSAEGAPDGWYWSDKAQDEAEGAGKNQPQLFAPRASNPAPAYGRYEYGSRDDFQDYRPPYTQPKWIRWVYAILLLAMSLPFILQLLEQWWRLSTGGP